MEGELDNTMPGRVSGWMRFAGLKGKMILDLQGDFHRDIRGAKIRLKGDGDLDNPEAASYLDGIVLHQTGMAGDITAGLPPKDYVAYPYIEWYGDENGRVVIELEPDQVKVIGRPIPARESTPISRAQQARNMAEYLDRLSAATGMLAVSVDPKLVIASDSAFSHWVVDSGRIIGEARSVKPADDERSFAFVRLFNMPDEAEFGYIATKQLQIKNGQAPA